MYEIEKDVEAPKRGDSLRKYPLSDMNVGDSFYVSAFEGDLAVADVSVLQNNIAVAAARVLGKGNYRTARDPGGVRVWRTA